MSSLDLNVFLGIGKKIRTLAKVIFVLGIVLSIITFLIFAIISISTFPGFFFLGLAISVIIVLFFYPSSLLIYGFGELIDHTSYIRKNSTNNTLTNN